MEKGGVLATMARSTQARDLLRSGVPLRIVLQTVGVSQQEIADRIKLTQASVNRALQGGPTARRQGSDTAMTVYRMAAKLLHVRLGEIVEARELLQTTG